MSKALVLYSDGSARPNPNGFGGWGVHGYLCQLDPPKKGAGHKTHLLTDTGYKAKLDANAKKHEVTPLAYFDMTGTIPAPTTNNVAELKAAIEATKVALEQDVSKFTLLTDSRMVVEGTKSWLPNWKRNGWVKKDGGPIGNLQLWKDLYDLKETLKSKSTDFTIEWVKGHGDNPGNIIADKLAVVGTFRSQKYEYKVQTDKSEPDGYWKHEVERNPLLSSPALFFNTLTGYNEPGLYYIGNKYKEDEIIGSATSDTAYGVVRLKTPDPIIEFIRDEQSILAEHGKRDLLVIARLDQIFKPDIHKDINEFGFSILKTKNGRWDLFHGTTDDPITRVLNPPKLAARAIEEITYLSHRLELFEKNDPSITVTDLSETFYEVKEMTKKKEVIQETVLKEEFIVGYSKLEVSVNYTVNGKVNQVPVILTFGSDIIGRNSLKRIEGQNPKIKVITWMESDLMFRYAVIVQTNEDIGIYACVHSNLRLTKK